MNSFAYPSMFVWLLVPLAIFVLGILHHRHRRAAMARMGEVETISRMLSPTLRRRRAWIQTCRVLGLLCLVVALAGPLIGAKLVEFKQKGIDVFIAVDCSLSMQAEDLKPNRMAHAKLLLGQLIERLAGSRIGIIAFAGQAHIMCPLTVDDQAARDILESIEVNTVPLPGTVVGDAIRSAITGLRAGEGGSRVLVLLTDGEDHKSKPLEAAKEASKVGLKIFPVGIGTPEGEPIPVFDESGRRTGYKRDRKGDVVLSKLDESTMIQIAQETGGQYLRASVTGDEIEQLARFLEELQQGDQKTRLFNRYENRFQWPLAAAILLFMTSLLIPERRTFSGGAFQVPGSRFRVLGKWLLMFLGTWNLVLGTTFASEAQLKKGNREFRSGNYEKALKLYEDALIDSPHSPLLKFNLGAAAYQSGDFSRAEKTFEEAAAAAPPGLQAAAHYNRGNALFRQQRWDDAIEAYKQSLRLNPTDEDAKYNLGVALQAKQNPPQQPSGSKKDDKDQKGGKPDPKEGPQGQPQPKPGQMSKEDAERLMAAAAASEAKKSGQKAPKGGAASVEEDW